MTISLQNNRVMNIPILRKHFKRIGAHLKVEVLPLFRQGWRGRLIPENREYNIDTIEKGKKRGFLLSVREDLIDDLDFYLLDVQPKIQHLLLLTKMKGNKERFLCGHDERHWFISEVSLNTNVVKAMESLKPNKVIASQHRHGVKTKNWHKRHNAGFLRQGEWFFLPRPTFEVENPNMILENEPLRRNFSSKPHIVSEIFRTGGETVYVSPEYPSGLREGEYRRLIHRKPHMGRLNWRVMRRNPMVYARGKVRHADHATIKLRFWHEVVINREKTTLGHRVVFLD